jgi:hypothetical protein
MTEQVGPTLFQVARSTGPAMITCSSEPSSRRVYNRAMSALRQEYSEVFDPVLTAGDILQNALHIDEDNKRGREIFPLPF